jgi:hypothetical protein
MKTLFSKGKTAAALLMLAAVLTAVPAAAVPLTPGQSANVSGTADPFVGATLLASTTSTFWALDFSGTLTQEVYGGGSLPGVSFLYKIVADPGALNAAMERLTMSFFAGFYTDLGFVQSTGTSDAPATVSRQANGNSVGFTWAVNDGIAPGTAAPYLYILTNANGFAWGGAVSLMNGFVTSVGAYKPVGVPEPMSLLLVGSGVTAIGISWLRGRRPAQQRDA